MCLAKIDHVWGEEHPYLRTKFAWKVFRITDGKLYGPFHHAYEPYPISKWVKSSEGVIRDGTGLSHSTYPAGFHSFESEQDAINYAASLSDSRDRYVALRVKIRHILVKGKDGMVYPNDSVFVSRYLYIPRPRVGLKNL